MNIKKLLKYIFSIYNDRFYKVICILGFKVKFFTKRNYKKCRQTLLKEYAKNHEVPEKAFNSLQKIIKNLEKKGFKLQDLDNQMILSNKRIKFETDSYALVAKEIFCDELYKIPLSLIDKHKKYCVLDIGANRGYTALYFADKNWVRRIDAFEIMPQTFNFALKNIALNEKLKKKINIYNYGLGADTKETEALCVPYRDGISTINQEWLQAYTPHAATAKPVTVQLVQASFFLKDLIEHRDIANIIFKIDCEGAEYEILQDLADNYPQLFEKIEIMIGETHCGFEKFLKIIAPFQFKIIEALPEKNGCCSFLLRKKEKNHG